MRLIQHIMLAAIGAAMIGLGIATIVNLPAFITFCVGMMLIVPGAAMVARSVKEVFDGAFDW